MGFVRRQQLNNSITQQLNNQVPTKKQVEPAFHKLLKYSAFVFIFVGVLYSNLTRLLKGMTMRQKSLVFLLSFFIFHLSLSSAQTSSISRMSVVGKAQKSVSEFVGVRDGNGRICAMIKVISDMDGFKYDAYNGVVKVDDQPGEDRVYLQPDERVLEIYKSGYEPLKLILSEYGIQLHQKEVWTIRIKGAPKTGDLLPVTIFVKPQDANITIDGKTVQNGKAVELSKGSHRLVIKKEGYKSIAKTISVSKNNVVFNYSLSEVDLQPVQIKSVPGGARIYLDNIEKGLTDDGYFLYPGTYHLKLTKNGYVEINKTITVSEDGNNTFAFKLLKNSGILKLNVTPASARILINQKEFTGKSTIELTPGTYDLEISLTGYLSQRESIEIERGKTLSRSYTLIKNSGSLSLNITPSGAKVLINKEDYSGRSQIELAPGRYKIELSKSGYYPQSEAIRIVRGKSLRKSYQLTAKTGRLQFKVKPLSANVTLKQNGRTVQSWTGMKYIKNLPVGDYELECTADDYGAQTKQITIEERQTVVVDVKLRRGGSRTAQSGNAGNDMVFIKGGTFLMGDTFGDGGNDEKPVHTVTVNDFYMSKYEVTFAQYDTFCEATGRKKPSDSGWGRGSRPVINVSWNDAVAYCKWVSKHTGEHYRLPTEAEWEYAAREGGRKVRFGNGKDIAAPDEINFDGRSYYKKSYSRTGVYRNKTKPVGSFKPNALGLYDMSGNVWEWCSDWYGEYYYRNSPQNNPKGPSSGSRRVVRGGGWYGGAVYARAANRDCDAPSDSRYLIGFRLVRTF